MMWRINSIMTACFDACFGFMESWPGWLSISVFAVLTGAIAMVAYKYTSNQTAIGRVRDDMKSSLLALKLYKDELPVTFRSQRRLFWGALRLFAHSMIPLAVMIVPMVLLVCQMALRYEWRPFRVGDVFQVYVELKPGTDRDIQPQVLLPPDGVVVEAGPSRVYERPRREKAEENEIGWRLRAAENGVWKMKVRVGEELIEKEVVVSDEPYQRVSPVRAGSGFVDQLLYPVERPASADDTIGAIRVMHYPKGESPVFGWDIHWVITYFIVSMIAALALKPVLKVKL